MGVIELPTLRRDQSIIWTGRTDRNVIRCGRRYGKTKAIVTIAGDRAVKKKFVGVFAPERKQWSETYDELKFRLLPLIRTSSKTAGEIRLKNGGLIDFWSLNDNELAGRGREYHDLLVDEAAFTKNSNMWDIWTQALEPTMATTNGRAWVFSTPFGTHPDNFFYKLCNEPEHNFRQYYAPTSLNPLVTSAWLARKKIESDPRVFEQEFLAQFVNWEGDSFFDKEKFLVDGQPVPLPLHVDAVYAIVDSATKTGKKNDGTACTYFALCKTVGAALGYKLVVLDWDIVQIEGALLETWLPSVFQRLEWFAETCKSRSGSLGAFIEDKDSGQILLQQARNRGWPATPIDSKLTAAGKSERAINISGYHYQGLIKMSQLAYDKVTTYKQQTRNHFLMQVLGFKIGVDNEADDLFDSYAYGVAIGLGNSEGY